MSFSNLGLSPEIVRAVTERGYGKPTPIQTQAIPVVLSGGDIMAGAQTGTGKTASFTLPLLHRLSANKGISSNSHGFPPIRALILTPTRELAAQVQESVRDYGKYLNLNSMVMFGGVSIGPQKQKLRTRVDILVSTPGRLLDHVQQGTVNLSRVEVLVLDEADRMLDMGFIHDIRRILALLPKQRQNLLFFATFSDKVKTLAAGLLNNPTMIEVARRNVTAATVSQKVYHVDRERKRQLLSHLIRENKWYQVLVFSRTKHGADRLVKQLGEDRIQALAIHGNKSQGARTHALAKFKDGTLQVLVATDIAARGLDISELPHVINYDLPNVPEDYVHRIGRTGRAGAEGQAISLVCVDEHHLLADIEKLIEQRLPKEVVDGFGVNPEIKAEPIPNGRKAPSGGGGNQRTRRSAPKSAAHKSSRQSSSPTAAGDKKLGSSSPTPRRSSKRR
ncbi:DEAD/DEAH box helicase [Dolichospermum sp. LEGE 00240]|jgi:ATP-dependent RNA helicase RhlE|uniref:DEAD/DEAH box helicase n=1 Tax=Dolichospermum sp. LEGE 00240 TaxID=1828603 RepID=UPI001880C008|nr:DEAD/DEAH box helicase [Dolichospermum sp. LEGE 00240]MDM3844917.1 DEAD/DEAH box helicase [Aphanizomenon gracile PMC638.10]MDM3850109.1 DEAD/DEAH box helicase [Aphanizomenon gracile PMC627.10]MDM3857573.1 DEAD/DEAH box helicase [Aphanizomenon gracile PMC649.10]MDM3859890.1 DEAD/DEAH box helicase [Aphanizomenon gracile PMC644.10]MBE9247916.1 DEAD/DEAH box helicase [Dolichospermum sp. LEGE 00240]